MHTRSRPAMYTLASNVVRMLTNILLCTSMREYSVITVEEQREVAKQLISYFKEQSLLQSVRSESLLGWTRANEISNGRWVMFGILVGLLTEYATYVPEYATQCSQPLLRGFQSRSRRDIAYDTECTRFVCAHAG